MTTSEKGPHSLFAGFLFSTTAFSGVSLFSFFFQLYPNCLFPFGFLFFFVFFIFVEKSVVVVSIRSADVQRRHIDAMEDYSGWICRQHFLRLTAN